MEPEWSLEQVNVFIGVSATLGVVWCTCLDYRASGCITVTVGDDRLMCDELKPSCVVDSRGNVVATLGDGEVDKYPVWRTNGKWLVKVNAAKNLVVYRMNNGVPVCPSHATVVRCTSLRPRNDGARFSPFYPCGDEVVLIGERGSGSEGGAFISFVDLEKSCSAGVTVEARESHSLPYSEASSFLWSTPLCACHGVMNVCSGHKVVLCGRGGGCLILAHSLQNKKHGNTKPVSENLCSSRPVIALYTRCPLGSQ
ncbi:hypothetical protein Pelo_18709 [Pelomyxa schiedti]|nr:hypothetical protein Pelo_18709 [Pelomyxa schiedti]